MNALVQAKVFQPAGFRVKLLVAMMFVVSCITALVLYFAQKNLASSVEHELQREFQAELVSLHNLQAIRQAALMERCRALVRKPRIHAALEDDALDLLYPSAKDELRDIMEAEASLMTEAVPYALHAEFYRFLDGDGRMIAPPHAADVGVLRAEEEAQLVLSVVPEQRQIGYLTRVGDDGVEVVSEIILMPILSTESGRPIAALVLGFKPLALGAAHQGYEIRRGIWRSNQLHMPGLPAGELASLSREVAAAIANQSQSESGFTSLIEGGMHQLFYKRLNPDSRYPPAYEVCVYPLADLIIRQGELRWQIISAGLLLVFGALGVSHILSGRLSAPVEKLAVDSADNLAGRTRAEAALESTNEELQRAARFSADASHQLKTPVAVLRAGLEELQAQEEHSGEVNQEIAALIHQTYRLSSVIDDLLLLSRMDAGRLKLKFGRVHLGQLIEAALDDLGAQPDASALTVETDFPADLQIAGDKHYVGLILQNLLENARKYNQPGGRIRLAAWQTSDQVFLTIGNTGQPIAAAAQGHIFERFHRGSIGENVPGYGLGLNLARELARLHQGELRLVRSGENWTEFEVHFLVATDLPTGATMAVRV